MRNNATFVAFLLAIASSGAHDAQPPTRLTLDRSPQFCVDVLMLSGPQEKLLPLLPLLRDPQRVEAAQSTLLEMIGRHEATLIDWPQLTGGRGEQVASQNAHQQRWPIEWTQPGLPQTFGSNHPSPDALVAAALGRIAPTTFETTTVGTELSAEGKVAADCTTVSVMLTVARTEFLAMRRVSIGTSLFGHAMTLEQPQFRVQKVASRIVLLPAARQLIYVGHQSPPDGPIVLYIAGAQIFPPISK
jgi:hypothetical protein